MDVWIGINHSNLICFKFVNFSQTYKYSEFIFALKIELEIYTREFCFDCYTYNTDMVQIFTWIKIF